MWHQEERFTGRIKTLTVERRFSVDFKVGAATIQLVEVSNGYNE